MLTIVPRAITGRNGGGRKKGTPNKINADVRAMILEALDDVGGPRYLSRQAQENPVAFMGLVGKILPTKISNEDGSPINLHLIAAQIISAQLVAEMHKPGQTIVATAEPQPANLLDAPVPTE